MSGSHPGEMLRQTIESKAIASVNLTSKEHPVIPAGVNGSKISIVFLRSKFPRDSHSSFEGTGHARGLSRLKIVRSRNFVFSETLKSASPTRHRVKSVRSSAPEG